MGRRVWSQVPWTGGWVWKTIIREMRMVQVVRPAVMARMSRGKVGEEGVV